MKRRGFTLIELMVVIAIIIILAAIAIPNYLSMTARAKKSRVSSDFAALATALESFKTDWGTYPVAAAYQTLVAGNAAANLAYNELTGYYTSANAAGGATVGAINTNPKSTTAGDAAPIVYMTSNILTAMTNPYNSANVYQYSGSQFHWVLYADEATGTHGATDKFLSRTDILPTLAETTGTTIPSVASTTQ